ncbi:MAG: ribonucleotide-diphosphate reductase subunit alpha, partial [Bifidobacteriaceae bacterium]|nr:ribonucleotide-diphosphate reductase subunit alpha [Bifidobacteriaceae bacterium]
MTTDYHSLNAMLNLYGEDGRIQFEADHSAVKEYFRAHVIPNTARFDSLAQKLRYLIDQEYYEADVFAPYSAKFVEE